jgi:hypothetical protein
MGQNTEIGFDVISENDVFTLVCDNTNWYIKHKHKGTAQIGVRDNFILLTFATEEERESYIVDNNLSEYIYQDEDNEINN